MNLELNVVSILLDLDALGILPPCLQEKLLDFLNFTWHSAHFSCRSESSNISLVVLGFVV